MSQVPVSPDSNSPVPVSKLCPQCGGGEFTKTRSKRWIAFGDDRVCNACSTRYAPPTPLWAALLFVPLGLVLGIAGLLLSLGGVLTILQGRADPLGLALGVGLLLVGPFAAVHGIRALLWPGRV